MKRILCIIAAVLLMAATSIQAQTTVIVDSPIMRSEATAAFTKLNAKVNGVRDTAKMALNAAYFRGRPSAAQLREAALQFVVAASPDTSNPDHAGLKAIADRMSAGRRLTNDQETFASAKYLAYVTKGSAAGIVALSTMDDKVAEADRKVAAAERRLTKTVTDTLATIANLRQTVAELKTAVEACRADLVALADNTANALRAKDPEGNRASKDEARASLEKLRRFGRGFDTRLASQ